MSPIIVPHKPCQQILASARRWRARLGTVECEGDLVMQSFEGDKKQKKDKKRDEQNQKKKRKRIRRRKSDVRSDEQKDSNKKS